MGLSAGSFYFSSRTPYTKFDFYSEINRREFFSRNKFTSTYRLLVRAVRYFNFTDDLVFKTIVCIATVCGGGEGNSNTNSNCPFPVLLLSSSSFYIERSTRRIGRIPFFILTFRTPNANAFRYQIKRSGKYVFKNSTSLLSSNNIIKYETPLEPVTLCSVSKIVH